MLENLWNALATAGLIAAALAAVKPQPELQLSRTLTNGKHTAEVRIEHSKVIVLLNRDFEDLPPHVVLAYTDDNNKPNTMVLKTPTPPEPEEPGFATYVGTITDNVLPREPSTSLLSLSQQNIVGLELRIPLLKGGPEILRPKPMD